MVKLATVGETFNAPIKEFYCDTAEDYNELKNNIVAPVGSKAFVLAEKKVKYMTSEGWQSL